MIDSSLNKHSNLGMMHSFMCMLSPSVAKVGGLQSQGARGEAVVIYCEPLATPDLESSDFPCLLGRS